MERDDMLAPPHPPASSGGCFSLCGAAINSGGEQAKPPLPFDDHHRHQHHQHHPHGQIEALASGVSCVTGATHPTDDLLAPYIQASRGSTMERSGVGCSS